MGMSATPPSFTVNVDQNRYLHEGGSEVHAIVSVDAVGGAGAANGPGAQQAVEVIIVDTSGSMYGNRIVEAKRAARAAVDSLHDGVRFAIVAGTNGAAMVYPAQETTAVCDAGTRAAAAEAIGGLEADGGTGMSTWLTLAERLFRGHEGHIRHAILLTDGHNNEPRHVLHQALKNCEGTFVCDARGVGTDWRVEDLRTITSALLGGFDIVADPQDLEEDFRSLTRHAMGKQVADVVLRLWAPQGAEVEFVKQVAPHVEDLTARRTEVDSRTGDYPTGTWGEESRDYHVCVRVPPGQVGRQMRAGWVRLVLPGPPEEVLGSGNILAEWTGDEARPPRSITVSPTTPARLSWPRPFRRACAPAVTATRPRPPSASAAPSSSPTSTATRPRPRSWSVWSMWWIRRAARSV
jgi:hypothetical protein